jgi:hypothetical protein
MFRKIEHLDDYYWTNFHVQKVGEIEKNFSGNDFQRMKMSTELSVISKNVMLLFIGCYQLIVQ